MNNDILIFKRCNICCLLDTYFHNIEKDTCLDCIKTNYKTCNKCNELILLKNFEKGRKCCKTCRKKQRSCSAHGKEKCKSCNKANLCIHGKESRRCKEGCGGQYICVHGKEKNRCIEGDCKGISMCTHGKEYRKCKEGCGGQDYCIHNKEKRYCKDKKCNGGTAYCKHSIDKRYCTKCNPKCSCINCNLFVVDKRSKNYPLCETCFSWKYPSETNKFKIKERYISDYLKKEFSDVTNIILDKKVEGGCSLKRPDILIDCFLYSIIIECDENQHKSYECENKRNMLLFQDLGNRHLIIIRFNPDSYIRKNNKKQIGCFKEVMYENKKQFYTIIEDEWNRRLNILTLVIKNNLNLCTFPEKEFIEIKLFYNNFD